MYGVMYTNKRFTAFLTTREHKLVLVGCSFPHSIPVNTIKVETEGSAKELIRDFVGMNPSYKGKLTVHKF